VDYKFSLDKVIIDTDRLGKIGLVINEIITNAMKYAFLDKKKGKIKIILKDSKENIEINISDNGRGIPKEVKVQNPDTLGLSLVEMLVKELEGTLTIKKEKGACFNIIIPKERAAKF
jgi:two-component sensor histidine kinase